MGLRLKLTERRCWFQCRIGAGLGPIRVSRAAQDPTSEPTRIPSLIVKDNLEPMYLSLGRFGIGTMPSGFPPELMIKSGSPMHETGLMRRMSICTVASVYLCRNTTRVHVLEKQSDTC